MEAQRHSRNMGECLRNIWVWSNIIILILINIIILINILFLINIIILHSRSEFAIWLTHIIIFVVIDHLKSST